MRIGSTLRGLGRGLLRLIDSLEALGYVVAFVLVVGLLIHGRLPRDFESWAYAALGAIVLAGVGLAIWVRRR
ncbi:MAG: hypothetical protein M3077_09200 [Candidatus Dormibacteraeota bacterium]|nr:hypothetical protein [Candidatus Dormibacteraeota bacterium]